MMLQTLLSSNNIESLLSSVRGVEHSKKLVVLLSNLTISDAANLLGQHRVLSAPVMEVDTSKFVGVVDMFDVLQGLLSVYCGESGAERRQLVVEEPLVESVVQWFRSFTNQPPPHSPSLSEKRAAFHNKTVLDIVGASKHSPFVTVNKSNTITNLVELFKDGVHRAVVVDQGQEPLTIVSQSDIIRFISKHAGELNDPLFNKTLKDLGLGQSARVVSLKTSAQALQGFFKMNAFKISAVAVVDEDGKLAANLSVSDLRGLQMNAFAQLLQPVTQFLKQANPEGRSLDPVKCQPTSTLGDVIKLLAENKVHRVWVVDSNNRPQGVVSMTDIMDHLLPSAPSS